MKLSEFRQKYPQYNDLSDQQLAEGLHKRFYSDIPFDKFSEMVELAPAKDRRGGLLSTMKDGAISAIEMTGAAPGALGIPGKIAKALSDDGGDERARMFLDDMRTKRDIAASENKADPAIQGAPVRQKFVGDRAQIIAAMPDDIKASMLEQDGIKGRINRAAAERGYQDPISQAERQATDSALAGQDKETRATAFRRRASEIVDASVDDAFTGIDADRAYAEENPREAAFKQRVIDLASGIVKSPAMFANMFIDTLNMSNALAGAGVGKEEDIEAFSKRYVELREKLGTNLTDPNQWELVKVLDAKARTYATEINETPIEEVDWSNTSQAADWLTVKLAGTAPDIAMTIAALVNPALATPYLGVMGTSSAGNKYAALVESGVPVKDADINALVTGGLEVATEKAGLDILGDKLTKLALSKPFLNEMKKRIAAYGSIALLAAGTEGGEEVLNAFGGNLTDRATGRAIANRAPADVAQEMANTPVTQGAIESFVVGAMAGAPTGAGAAIGVAARSGSYDDKQKVVNTVLNTDTHRMLDDAQISTLKTIADEVNAVRPGAVDISKIDAEINRRAQQKEADAALENIQNAETIEEAIDLAVKATDVPVEAIDITDVLTEEESVSDTTTTTDMAAEAAQNESDLGDGSGLADALGRGDADVTGDLPRTAGESATSVGQNISLGTEAGESQDPLADQLPSVEEIVQAMGDGKQVSETHAESLEKRTNYQARSVLEGVVKRRSAAQEMNRLANYDRVVEAGKKLMAGESVNVSRLKLDVSRLKGDQRLYEAGQQLIQLATAPGKDARDARRGAYESYMQRIQSARTQDELQTISGEIAKDTILTDKQIEELDDRAMSAMDSLDTQVEQLSGEQLDKEWTAFADDSGSLGIPRSEMPQIKAEHRGAMVNFLEARGISHEADTVQASELKPTQLEFSPKKVEKAKKFTGGSRSILVSADGHVLDGHHQWMAALDARESIDIIRLGAPIRRLIEEVREFPSAEASKGVGTESAEDRKAENRRKASERMKERQRRLRIVDPAKDTMLVAMAKVGGFRKGMPNETDIKASLGIEKNQNLRVNIGGGFAWLFTKDGLSISQMAERMHEYGYIDAPEESALEESLAEYRGENHSYAYVPEYAEAMEALVGEVTQAELEAADTWTLADAEAKYAAIQLAQDVDWDNFISGIAVDDNVLASISEQAQDYHDQFLSDLGDYYAQLEQENAGNAGQSDAAAARKRDEDSGRGGTESRQESTASKSQTQDQEVTDLLGDNTASRQAVADAERAKDERRNSGESDTTDFVLTGSDRPADQAAARGARDLFSEPAKQAQPTDVKAPESELDKAKEALQAAGVKGKEYLDTVKDVRQGNLTADEVAEAHGQKIEDFGEKMAGARKDMVAAARKEWSDEDLAAQPLSKIWPIGDIDAIEDPYVAAWAFASRAEIPPKPRTAYKVARWVASVKSLRLINQMALEGKLSKDVIQDKQKQYPALAKFEAKVRLLEQLPRDQWKRVDSVEEFPDAYVFEGSEKVPKPTVIVKIDGTRHYFDGTSVDEVLDKVKEKLSQVPDTSLKFEVRGRPGKYNVYKQGDKGYNKLSPDFSESKEAFEYIRNNYNDLVAAWEAVKELTNVKKADVRGKENKPRTGKDWRNGKNVTPEQFAEQFGFRGIEWGNWVNQGKGAKERQGMLNQAYDALMDLADIINIPPKAISLNGTLGIAFGSRGSGSASAHFEPDNLVINLTKTRGAGTLAHEWFHALDNYFQRARPDFSLAGRHMSYITYAPENYYIHRKSGTRIPETDYKMMADGGKDRQGRRFLRNHNPDEWELVEGVRPVVSEAFADLVKALNNSPMLERSRLIDSGKSDGYWSRIIERAARSFENYVKYKMRMLGYDNDYLANVMPADEFQRESGRYPYLLENEIEPIAQAFDNLFSVIETKETDEGVALFSRSKSTPLNERISAVIANEDVAKRKPLTVSETSPAPILALGFDDFPVVIRTGNDGIMKMHYEHGLSADGIAKALESGLNEPTMMLQHKGQAGVESIWMVTDTMHNGMPIVLAIRPDQVNRAGELQHLVATALAIDPKVIASKIRNGDLLYRNTRVNQPDVVKLAVQSAQKRYAQSPRMLLGAIPNRAPVRGRAYKVLSQSDLVKNQSTFSRSGSSAPIFYSQLARGIDSAKFESAPAGQWRAWLTANAGKLGVKKDEIQWTGITDWLELQTGKVSKADIQAYLDGNGVQVQEVVLSAEERSSRYDMYTVPGGENYKELLLTLPEREPRSLNEIAEEMYGKRFSELGDEEANRVALEESREKNAISFRSSHFPQKNILAHVRFDERTDADGNRVLFINEIQSDWGQEGKKKGFDKPLNTDGWTATEGEGDPASGPVWEVRNSSGQWVLGVPRADVATPEAAIQRAARAGEASRGGNQSSIPIAPFVTDTKAWVALAVKRMMRYAAENGFDKVAFISGRQAADLYDLSKHIDSIEWLKNDRGYAIAADKDGITVIEKSGLSESELVDTVGKEVAEKITSSAKQSGKLTGLDLKVGGEGMRAFYDQIVPQVAKDVIKRIGGDGVKEIKFQGERYPSNIRTYSGKQIAKTLDGQQLGFDITPEMREKILSGLPLFDRYLAGTGMTVADVERAVNRIRAGWKNAPEIIVVENMNDSRIRKAVREENERQMSQGAEGEPEGFFDAGKVYVVASALNSERDVARVVLHETLGHYGLRGVFGDQLKPILNQVSIARRKDVLAKAKSYGLDIKNERDRLIAAEEVLAEMAQTNPQIGFVKRAIAAIRNWLRKHVPYFKNLELTDNDIIQGFLLPARRFVEGRNQSDDVRGMIAAFVRNNRRPSKEQGDTFITAALEYLSRDPEFFQAPASESKDIYAIGQDIDPGFRIEKLGPSMTREKGADRAWEVFVPNSKHRAGIIMTKGDKVWVDLQFLHAGTDRGSRIYAIAADYAHNNGKVLIGDPAGLSKLAYYRRNENMLSSALKHGTTRHLMPHMAQMNPEGYWTDSADRKFAEQARPLTWVVGDDVNNIKELVYNSYDAAIKNVPEIKDVIYDPESGDFKYTDGRPFTREDSERIAAELSASSRPYRAGSATLKRAALFNTFLRQSGSEGRRQLLDRLVDQLQGRGLKNSALRRVMYSRTQDQTQTQKSRAEQVTGASANHRRGSEDFGQPATYTFNEADYRPSVVAWAKERFGNAMAANGKPAWQNFVRWFGDSKVVDAEGKPLVMYHGTTSNPDVYSRNQSEYGAAGFFTPNPKFAEQYVVSYWEAKNPLELSPFNDDVNLSIQPVFISAKNPWDFKNAKHVNTLATALAPLNLETEYELTPENLASGNYEILESSPAIFQTIEKLGFDGVWLRERGERNIAVFKGSQIKSAIGNNGNFDPSNPDIRFSRQQRLMPSWDSPETSKIDDVIYALQDKNIDLKRVTQAINETGAEIDDRWDAYLQEELFHGRSAKRTQEFIKNELEPLIEEMRMRGVTMQDFEHYLWARHAEERNEQIAKINPDMPDGGSGITTQEARDYLSSLDPQKRKHYEALAKRVDAITHKTRQTLVDYGLESASTIATWNKAYKNYVPLMREEMDTGFAGTGQGYSVRGKESKRAMGSRLGVVDILANIAQQRERAIIRGEKNRVATALVGMATLNPLSEFWQVNKIPTIRYVNERTNQVEERPDPNYKNRPNVVVAKVMNKRGEIVEHAVVFNEFNERAMRMAASIKNLDVDDLSTLAGWFAPITRYFASINTQYNPVFGIINIIRDVQGAVLNLESTPLKGMQREVLAYTGSALKGIYQEVRARRSGEKVSGEWSELWEEFEGQGAKTGYRDLYRNAKVRSENMQRALDPEWWQKKTWGKVISAGGLLAAPQQFLVSKPGKALFNWLSDYNETLENAVRLAAYKKGLELGLSKQRAASIAKNLTVNFNRKGAWGREIGALYAFYNASIQGTARIAETILKRDANGNYRMTPAGRAIVYGGLLLGSMQALALAAAGYDDDEPPEFVRDRNLIIPLDFFGVEKKYISIPMPLGYNAIPATGRILTEWALDGFEDTPERIAHLLEVYMDMFNPIGYSGLSMQTLTPTALDPVAALSENKDWTGQPIARKDFSSLDLSPGHTRAKDTASVFARGLSYGLNKLSGGSEFAPGVISPTPDQIDYLIGQLSGGVGREYLKTEQTATALVTGEALPIYKIPIVGRFYGDARSSGAQGGKFYNNITRMNTHQREIMGRLQAGEDIEKYLKDNPEAELFQHADRVYGAVQKMRKHKRMMQAAGASRDEIAQIESEITELMASFNEEVRKLNEM